jgi:hypothetical protein
MKLNTFMMIAAIIALIFGLGFILAPAASLKPYGVSTDLTGLFLGRYFGASLIGLSFVNWLTRNTASKGLLTGLFVTMLLGFLVALYDKFAGNGNALIWLNVVIYLLLAIGFGYFAFMKKD